MFFLADPVSALAQACCAASAVWNDSAFTTFAGNDPGFDAAML